jgi:diguanylate cyclase (GGDEF)-like protein/PAS domain S-box-containing protein
MRVLLVEDNAGDARLLRDLLRDQTSQAIELTHVECMMDAEAWVAEHRVDVILLDLGLPDVQGLDAVRHAQAIAPRIPLMVLTGNDDDSLALQSLQEGAQDYHVKGQVEIRGLLRSLRYAIERKTMEKALFREKERAQVTLNCIGDGVISTDLPGNITFLNIVAANMTGWSSEAAANRPLSEVFRTVDMASPDGAQRTGECRIGKPSNCILIRRDGVQTPIELSRAPIHDCDDDQASGAVIVFRDVSEARAMASKMIHTAHHDFLTGLPNRVYLKDRVGQAIIMAQRHKRRVGLLFLDLDGFKHINDSLGHALGDKLLQSVAGRLSECARGSDMVSRQGGDEFVVLLSEIQHAEDAAIAARRMLEAVAQTHATDDHELHITMSIGVSVFPEDGLDAETLIRNADTAMYQAKETGRDSYQFFTPAMNARAVERQFLEENLRRALDRNELALHYQPKVGFRTGTIVGAEALLRWTHPIRGPISPEHFIPVAEDCGLIKRIGSWVLREACRQARAWTDAGMTQTTMAVNVSAIEFRDEGFLEGLFAILEETGFDPRLLELELTESVLMKHADSVASTLNAVRAIGVQVAVDDFGTGYSSLSYLHQFPVDALKIDKSFVAQITADGDTSIVPAVISMAKSLKLRVVAEGVETIEQLRFLRKHHCDEAQGYYLSRPVLPERFQRLVGVTDSWRSPMRSASTSCPVLR